MSSLHPMLEKQRKKVQREQRGWILIAVGVCLLNVTGIRMIRAVIYGCSQFNVNPSPPTPAPDLPHVVAAAPGWWLMMLCAWALVTIACRLRGLATFRGGGFLLLTITFVIATIDVAMCIYIVDLLYSPPQIYD